MSQTQKFHRLLPRDPARLHSVEEWIRGFRVQQLPNLPNVFYCRKCGIRILACPDPVTITDHPCGPIQRLDEAFWQRVSNRIKQHHRKDRLLFARINADCPGVPLVPELQGPLAWVTSEWKRATRPPGRPRDLEKQLFLAYWLHSLARPRLVMVEEGQSQDEVLRSSRKNRGSTAKRLLSEELKLPRWQKLPPMMTLTGAIELLTGIDIAEAKDRRVSWRQNQLFGGFATEQLMQWRTVFQAEWKKKFEEIPIPLSRREAERMLKLHERIKSGWKARIKGLKLREMKSKKTKKAGDFSAQVPNDAGNNTLKRTS